MYKRIYAIRLNVGFTGTIKAPLHLLGLPSYVRIAINDVVIHKDEAVVLNHGNQIQVLMPFKKIVKEDENVGKERDI